MEHAMIMQDSQVPNAAMRSPSACEGQAQGSTEQPEMGDLFVFLRDVSTFLARDDLAS
jgi:hypothetical protein